MLKHGLCSIVKLYDHTEEYLEKMGKSVGSDGSASLWWFCGFDEQDKNIDKRLLDQVEKYLRVADMNRTACTDSTGNPDQDFNSSKTYTGQFLMYSICRRLTAKFVSCVFENYKIRISLCSR